MAMWENLQCQDLALSPILRVHGWSYWVNLIGLSPSTWLNHSLMSPWSGWIQTWICKATSAQCCIYITRTKCEHLWARLKWANAGVDNLSTLVLLDLSRLCRRGDFQQVQPVHSQKPQPCLKGMTIYYIDINVTIQSKRVSEVNQKSDCFAGEEMPEQNSICWDKVGFGSWFITFCKVTVNLWLRHKWNPMLGTWQWLLPKSSITQFRQTQGLLLVLAEKWADQI